MWGCPSPRVLPSPEPALPEPHPEEHHRLPDRGGQRGRGGAAGPKWGAIRRDPQRGEPGRDHGGEGREAGEGEPCIQTGGWRGLPLCGTRWPEPLPIWATQVLDKLLLYLRIVHSVDYYNTSEYLNEDEMPNRCGIIHVRGPIPPNRVTHREGTGPLCCPPRCLGASFGAAVERNGGWGVSSPYDQR